jgi:hypothetical protein
MRVILPSLLGRAVSPNMSEGRVIAQAMSMTERTSSVYITAAVEDGSEGRILANARSMTERSEVTSVYKR